MQKVHDMNIATEPKPSGKPISESPRARPVRMCAGSSSSALLLAAAGRRDRLASTISQPDDRAVLRQQQTAAGQW